MSNPRDERYYSSIGKSRRSTPVVDSQGSVFPQGQGGRTVLPPISSAFPNSHFPVPVSYSNEYTQPRSSPRYEYGPVVYNQWPVNYATSSTQPSSFTYYDDTRYPQTNYAVYPRSSTPMANPSVETRKLPPLATQSYDRYNQSHTASSSHGGHIRSPTASYPPHYFPAGPSYSYNVAPQPVIPAATSLPPVANQRSSPPYGHSAAHIPLSCSPPPVSPTSSEEPTIKKKRKRADAAQLKILTETYNRTAFPSTEERIELAKILDMTPRSVQIWFQNRRQSMRQTRQSSAATSTQQAFAMNPEVMTDNVATAASYDMQLHAGSYVPATHTSPTLTSAHRRPRSQETVVLDSHKQWPRAY